MTTPARPSCTTGCLLRARDACSTGCILDTAAPSAIPHHTPDAASRAEHDDTPEARPDLDHDAPHLPPGAVFAALRIIGERIATPADRAELDAAASAREADHVAQVDANATIRNRPPADPITDPMHGATLTGMTADDVRTMRDERLQVTADRIGVTPGDLARARALGAQHATMPMTGTEAEETHGYGHALDLLTGEDRPHARIRRAVLRAAFGHGHDDARAAALLGIPVWEPPCSGCPDPDVCIRTNGGCAVAARRDDLARSSARTAADVRLSRLADDVAEADAAGCPTAYACVRTVPSPPCTMCRARLAQDENDAARGLPVGDAITRDRIPLPAVVCNRKHPGACHWTPGDDGHYVCRAPRPYAEPLTADDPLPDPADPLDVPDPTLLARARWQARPAFDRFRDVVIGPGTVEPPRANPFDPKPMPDPTGEPDPYAGQCATPDTDNGPCYVTGLYATRTHPDNWLATQIVHPAGEAPIGPFPTHDAANRWADLTSASVEGAHGCAWTVVPLTAPPPAAQESANDPKLRPDTPAEEPPAEYLDTPADVRIARLQGCARCHGDGHDDLAFRPLAHHVTEGGVVVATHWTPCPTNGQPILLIVRPARDSEGSPE